VPPCIHLSATEAGSEAVFVVRDNGKGIETKYQERHLAS
jgi:hypothetical protein